MDIFFIVVRGLEMEVFIKKKFNNLDKKVNFMIGILLNGFNWFIFLIKIWLKYVFGLLFYNLIKYEKFFFIYCFVFGGYELLVVNIYWIFNVC